MSIHVFDVGELSIDFNAAEVYNSWEDYMREVLDDDEGEEYIDLDGVGGNREFAPLSPIDVDELRELTIIESQHLHDIHEGHRTISDIHEAEEVFWEEDRAEPFMILDVGVRTVVMALLGIGAEPFSSCNGGCFEGDGHHTESYPLVAMYGPDDVLELVENAARKHQCGLYNAGGFGSRGGWCSMLMMSENLWQSRMNSFDSLKNES